MRSPSSLRCSGMIGRLAPLLLIATAVIVVPRPALAQRERKRADPEEDRLEREPRDGRVEDAEPPTDRDRDDQRDRATEAGQQDEGADDPARGHGDGSPVATAASPVRAASAAPPSPPEGNRAESQAYEITPSRAVGRVVTSR